MKSVTMELVKVSAALALLCLFMVEDNDAQVALRRPGALARFMANPRRGIRRTGSPTTVARSTLRALNLQNRTRQRVPFCNRNFCVDSVPRACRRNVLLRTSTGRICRTCTRTRNCSTGNRSGIRRTPARVDQFEERWKFGFS